MPLALFEHINLNILDEAAAHDFYVKALGAVVNQPATNDRQLHVNMGVSQFHLLLQYSTVEGIKPVTAAQLWSGEIELWTEEPLDAAEKRLKELGVKFERPAADCLRVCCPWGNKFLLRAVDTALRFDWGSHPSGSGTLAAMPRVVHYVRPGAAVRLHAFWKDTMGATCELQPSGTLASWRAGSDAACSAVGEGEELSGLSQCVVHFNTKPQQLVFAERRHAPPADAYEHSEALAYHICVYVEDMQAFKACFEACEAAGLLYANPVFARSPPQFGNAMSWDEAESCGQFRIKDLGGGGGSGEAAALVLEMEIRSPKHMSCPLGRQRAVGRSEPAPAAGDTNAKKRRRE